MRNCAGKDADGAVGRWWDGGWGLRVGWRVADATAAQARDEDKDYQTLRGSIYEVMRPHPSLSEADGNTSLEYNGLGSGPE